MNSMYDQRFRDIILLSVGFLGALWFFMDINNHWAPSVLDMSISDERIIEKADSIFLSWDYQPVSYGANTKLVSSDFIVDSLQKQFGTSDFINQFRNGEKEKLPLYKRSVSWHDGNELQNEKMSMELAKNGELVSFRIAPEIINAQTPFNRNLLIKALESDFESASIATLDTVVSGLVDYQHNREVSSNYRSMREVFSRRQVGEGGSGLSGYLSSSNIWNAAEYYIKKSYWKRFTFKRDSLSFDDQNGYKVVKAFFVSKDTVMGVSPGLEVEVLPAGSLHRMKPTYPNLEGKSSGRSLFVSFIETGFMIGVLSFAVWLLIIFYLRIKAKAIDMSPALVVALLAGFMVSGMIALEMFNSVAFDTNQIFSVLFSVGIFGAISSAGFFLLTSVSDSITRQYWPSKLTTWDLVRRGMFKNKPVGWSVLRGLGISGVLIGVYMVFLEFVPGTYLDSTIEFDTSAYMFGSIANLLKALLESLIIIVPLFLIVTNQLTGVTNKKWLVPVISGLCFALLAPLDFEVNPAINAIILNLILGIILGLFYIAFDFVSLSLAFFIFLNLLFTKKGWVIDSSPDASLFYVFIVVLSGLIVVSIMFIYRGNETNELPDYVPDYLEDLAKEQRVRQELDIARTVQKTFLPNITPDIEGFDAAALCDPALDTGGDYYDIIRIDEHRTAVAIGDVSGKGIRAAFYMTFAKGVIHSLCSILDSPKTLMVQANRLFNENATRGTFISMIYGVLDSREKAFTYVRAGHNPILHKKASGETAWLQPKGVAIGMTKGDSFEKACEEVTVQLQQGDVLVLYTDGVTEAQNKDGEFYGEDRLVKLLEKENTESSIELRNLIANDVRSFFGEETQYDDMTLVVIKA